jgi:arginase
MNDRSFGIIGVPSAAGAHSPGVEKAPQALRAAGIADALSRHGATVVDSRGDLPLVPFAIDHRRRYAQNIAAVAHVATALASEVEAMLRGDSDGDGGNRGDVPLILGGDCTILLGVLAGQVRREPSTALVYLDARPDLNTPQSVVQGALDWMGMSHVLAQPDAVEQLTTLGPRVPLLDWRDVTFFGVVDSELTAGERALREAHPERFVSSQEIARGAGDAAGAVADELAGGHARIVVHFDVDVLDFVDFPIADNAYQRNQGLTLDNALAALSVFAESPAFGGLVITEVNPDHVPSDSLLESFVDRLAGALMSRTQRPRD